jgi:hypothetical protein
MFSMYIYHGAEGLKPPTSIPNMFLSINPGLVNGILPMNLNESQFYLSLFLLFYPYFIADNIVYDISLLIPY